MTAVRAGATPHGTVLVVDDEASVRASLRAILEPSCHVVDVADIQTALDTLRRQNVDLVLLDQHLPDGQGLDVLLQIKSLDPTIVVVLATAERDVKTVVEAIKRGAYDYIVKPFDVDDIVLLAHRALQKRALEREVLCLRSELALPGLACRGDVFHALYPLGPLVRYLENRAYEAIATRTKLERKHFAAERRRGRSRSNHSTSTQITSSMWTGSSAMRA